MVGLESVRVDEFDADVLVLDEDFAGLGLGHERVGLVLQDFGTAGLVDRDASHGGGDGGRHGADGGWEDEGSER